MEENEIVVKTKSYDTRDKIAKTLLGTIATLIATGIVEAAYDAYMTKRRNRTAEIQQ